jgi:hypothetical protein
MPAPFPFPALARWQLEHLPVAVGCHLRATLVVVRFVRRPRHRSVPSDHLIISPPEQFNTSTHIHKTFSLLAFLAALVRDCLGHSSRRQPESLCQKRRRVMVVVVVVGPARRNE